jgi:hypothetical protein
MWPNMGEMILNLLQRNHSLGLRQKIARCVEFRDKSHSWMLGKFCGVLSTDTIANVQRYHLPAHNQCPLLFNFANAVLV